MFKGLPLLNELADAGILIHGPGLLARERLRPVGIDPPQHPIGYSHEIVLRLGTGDDSAGISRHPLQEIVLNIGLYLPIL